MKTMNNAYFQKMYETCCEYYKIQKAHEETKRSTYEQFGWDSQEMKEWYAKDEEIKKQFPYSGGEMKAYWMYSNNLDEEDNEPKVFEVSDYCWDTEIPDFISTIRKARIQSFVFTNSSTAVMENIHGFINEGCTLEGPCVLEKKEWHFRGEQIQKVLGLKFKVN